jgi:hypothetical protein
MGMCQKVFQGPTCEDRPRTSITGEGQCLIEYAVGERAEWGRYMVIDRVAISVTQMVHSAMYAIGLGTRPGGDEIK